MREEWVTMNQDLMFTKQPEQYFDHSGNWYVVIEGAHPAYDTRQIIYTHIPAPEWVAIYDIDPFKPLATHSPCLLKVDNPAKWLALWNGSFPELSGSFLFSNAPLETLADHLRKLISVQFEGRSDALFRFHDSWILQALYPELSQPERIKLHGPIKRWVWICGNRACQAELDAGPDRQQWPQTDGWLSLDRTRQEAIREGLIAKRNWMEASL